MKRKMIPASQPLYFDLVQTDPKIFNESQKKKQKQLKDEKGDNYLREIMWSEKHHPVKASKSVDYRLSDVEYNKLQNDGILFKQFNENIYHLSFARRYLDLYNNDMPVFITSDSMLYAVHKFYDDYLKDLEETLLISKFTKLCNNILNLLHTLKSTTDMLPYLRDLEVYFMLPFVILQLNNELSEAKTKLKTIPYFGINKLNNNEFTMDEAKKLFDVVLSSTSSQNEQREIDEVMEGYDKVDRYVYFDDYNDKKLKNFVKLFGYDYSDYYKLYKYYKIIIKSPKLYYIFKSFECPDLDKPLNFKYGGEHIFNALFENIAKNQDLKFDFCGIEMEINGTQFKPRGHYTESFELKKYFMAFIWLSKFNISINIKNNNVLDCIKLACIFTKLGECYIDEFKDLQDFISKIIGESDGYNVCDFLKLINQFIPNFKDINDTLSYIIKYADSLTLNIMNSELKKSNLTKFGDDVENTKTKDQHTTISFSMIGKGNQIDNMIIQKLVDAYLVDDNGNVPMRKFPSIFDLVYTLFDNKSVDEHIQRRMKNIEVGQRDGYHYWEHLKKLDEYCNNHIFGNTIYAQELKMLRALMADRELLKSKNLYPFTEHSWGKKQAQTQIGHYAELRHDNVLYVDEVCGGGACCEFADLMVEPCPTFWKEFLVLIKMLKSLTSININKCYNKILDNFETTINNFISFLDAYLNGQEVDKDLLEKLSTIVKEIPMGSGGPFYQGWYMKLFKDDYDALKFKPEVCNMFTGVNDIRGPGGIVHLGTGPTQMMYIIINDGKTEKIFLGPTYTVYEVVTDYNIRLNDDEWNHKYTNYNPLNF